MEFAVDCDLNVAAWFGFGGGDHAKGGFEASEGGDLWFGGSFGDFGGFDHLLWFLFGLVFSLTRSIIIDKINNNSINNGFGYSYVCFNFDHQCGDGVF